MRKLSDPIILRVVLLPLLGAAGAVLALVWPIGHKAFCSGITGVLA